jgi:hypothetical protein
LPDGLIEKEIFVPPLSGRINLMQAHKDEYVDAMLDAAKVSAAGLAGDRQ